MAQGVASPAGSGMRGGTLLDWKAMAGAKGPLSSGFLGLFEVVFWTPGARQ
jgi:hypothetical protein